MQRNVARMWEGIVSTEDADAYHAYLRETGLADYASTPGYVEGFVLRRDDPDASRTSFLLLTFWESWDAIRAFAGEEIERAKYYPDDDEYLLSMTETVEHFEVVENFDPRPPASGPGAPRPTGGGR